MSRAPSGAWATQRTRARGLAAPDPRTASADAARHARLSKARTEISATFV